MRQGAGYADAVNVPPPADGLPPVLPDAPPPAPAPAPRWRWWVHLLVIGCYPLLIGLAGLRAVEARGPVLTDSPQTLLHVTGAELIFFGIIFGLGWLASRASARELLLPWRGGFWVVPLGIGYSIGLRLALAVGVGVIGALLILAGVMTPEALREFFMANRPDVERIVDVTAMRENPVYFWLTLTFVSFVVAGFREELWRAGVLAGLRALWPRWFGSRAGELGAVAIAAVIFGIGHATQGPLAIVITALLGFGLGAIMVLHRSIWPAVIAHGMFNATSFAMLPWAIEKLQELQ
jgi:membrane protease YdiL (CAAX protease family)